MRPRCPSGGRSLSTCSLASVRSLPVSQVLWVPSPAPAPVDPGALGHSLRTSVQRRQWLGASHCDSSWEFGGEKALPTPTCPPEPRRPLLGLQLLPLCFGRSPVSLSILSLSVKAPRPNPAEGSPFLPAALCPTMHALSLSQALGGEREPQAWGGLLCWVEGGTLWAPSGWGGPS